MPIVKFVPESKEISCDIGKSVLEVARSAGIEILAPCGGKASCGRCIVKVIQGKEFLSSPTEEEKAIVGFKRLSDGYRLGCRCRVIGHGDITIYVPPESRALEYVLLTEGYVANEVYDPPLKKVEILAPRKSKDSILKEAIKVLPKENVSFSIHALRNLSKFIDGIERKIYLVIHEDEVLDVKDHGNVLGFALDVGTTKLAGYLVDISSGSTLATVSDINPQIAYGEDVVSRIAYAIKNGVHELQRKVVASINSMIERACNFAKVNPNDVYEVVAVGNTVMHHILLGLDLKSIAYFPYTPIVKDQIYIKASEIGLSVNDGAKLFLPPLIAGYIGSDVVADVLATNIYKDCSRTMLIDIGTNTEIVIGKDGRFFACSTASGPAFEGAHIKFGMRAAKGAIDSIEISPDGEVRYTVIGGGKPIGITGSAVIDAIAGLYDIGMIDTSGRFCKTESSRLRLGEDGYLEFVIAYKDETAIGTDIVLTQKDIREIQLAKAAIRSGINILLKKIGIDEKALDSIYIAGAFGSFINPISAIKIGMFPKVDVDKIRVVGNAAGAGARMMLLSKSLRSEASKLADAIEYVELAIEPDFQSEFINSIQLPRDIC